MSNHRDTKAIIERLKKKRSRFQSYEGSNLSYLKWDDGQSRLIRLLPPKKGIEQSDPIVDRLTHWNLGPHGDSWITCPESLDDSLECVICKTIKEMKESGDPEYETFYDTYRRRFRSYAQAVDLDEIGKGPYIWPMPLYVRNTLMDYLTDPEYGLDLVSWGAGIAITVTRTGKSVTGTRYSLVPQRRVTQLVREEREHLIEKWKKSMIDLDEFMAEIYTPEEVEMCLRGEISSSELRQARAEAAKKGTSGPTRQKKKR